MLTETAAYSAIAMVVAVTFLTRLAGPVFMSFIGTSPRLQRFLEAMAVSVIAAIVASLATKAGGREIAALTVAAGIMLLTRSTIGAMLSGAALAAGWYTF